MQFVDSSAELKTHWKPLQVSGEQRPQPQNGIELFGWCRWKRTRYWEGHKLATDVQIEGLLPVQRLATLRRDATRNTVQCVFPPVLSPNIFIRHLTRQVHVLLRRAAES